MKPTIQQLKTKLAALEAKASKDSRIKEVKRKLEAVTAKKYATNKELRSFVDSRIQPVITELTAAIKKAQEEDGARNIRTRAALTADIQRLKQELSSIDTETAITRIGELSTRFDEEQRRSETAHSLLLSELMRLQNEMRNLVNQEPEDWAEKIEELRKDINRRIGRIGGGNANRNIAIGGNTSVLSTFTDINIKPGNNVTLTYSNNQVTKYLDLTISASGGSSVSGITRSVNRINTSQTAGNTTGTDYVYNCTDGVNLTLPDVVGITNLYTVKNIAPSSVLISTTGGQTIDGDTTLILATQFTSVDLVNDGNDNWAIT